MIFNLTREGIAVLPGSLTAVEMTRMKRRLMVTSKGFKDRIMTMQAFHTDRTTKITYFARMKGIVELGKLGHSVVNVIPEGDELSTDISGAALILQDFQEPIYKYISELAYGDAAFRLAMTSCLLDLQPGKGKTFIAMALLQYISKKTLFVVPGKDLLKQTVDTLTKVFPMLRIGQYSSTTRTDGDVVVMTVDSASSGDSYTFKTVGGKKISMTATKYFERFGYSVFDEIHMYCTKERQSVFTRCTSLFTLGISGTVNHRPDKMDPISHFNIGDPVSGSLLMKSVMDAKPLADQKPWKFKAVCLKYNGPAKFTESIMSAAGTISHPLMISQFSKDPFRSQLLVNTIRALVDAGDQTFVMLDRTELVRLAWDYLRTALQDSDIWAPELQKAAMVTGKVKDADRGVARKSRVVVGTYSCIGTGLSWDEFNAVVFFHPRRNKFEQFNNRIFRENGDRNKERKAYFLQDNATSLKSQYYGFRKVCIDERQTTPEVETHQWDEIEVSPELQKIAQEFALWDDARRIERERVKQLVDKPRVVLDEDEDDI